jgi:hypothetical protein
VWLGEVNLVIIPTITLTIVMEFVERKGNDISIMVKTSTTKIFENQSFACKVSLSATL